MRNFETVLMELPRRFERKFMGCRRAGNVRVSEPVQHARLPQVTPAGGEAFSSLGGQPGGRKPGRWKCGFLPWLARHPILPVIWDRQRVTVVNERVQLTWSVQANRGERRLALDKGWRYRRVHSPASSKQLATARVH